MQMQKELQMGPKQTSNIPLVAVGVGILAISGFSALFYYSFKWANKFFDKRKERKIKELEDLIRKIKEGKETELHKDLEENDIIRKMLGEGYDTEKFEGSGKIRRHARDFKNTTS